MTDAEIVREVLAGRVAAFDALVTRHHLVCLRFASHFLGERADAEDVVQETFVRAYRGLARYQERQTFRAWLFRILINRCRSASSSRGRRRARFVHDERILANVEDPAPMPNGAFHRKLELALASLDAPHREAFLLKFGEGLEYEEIARITGAGVSALKMRVKRARDRVRARWEGIGS